MQSKGRVEISQRELIELPCGKGRLSDIAMLLMMKRHGVPVTGTIMPRLVKGIIYHRHDNPETGGVVITWEPEP